MYVWRFVIALALLAPSLAQAVDPVVIATPQKVTFVMAEGDLPQNRSNAAAFVGGVSSTELRVREVLQGEVPERVITVNLVATSRENLSKAKELGRYAVQRLKRQVDWQRLGRRP